MEAARIAVLLDKLNRERKAIEDQHAGGGRRRAEQMVEGNPTCPCC